MKNADTKPQSTLFFFLFWRVLPVGAVMLAIAGLLIFISAQDIVRTKILKDLSDANSYEREVIQARIDSITGQAVGLAVNELVINGLIDQGDQANSLPLFFRSLKLASRVSANVTLTDYKGRPVYSNKPLDQARTLPERWLATVIEEQRIWRNLSAAGLSIVAPVIYSGLAEGALHIFVSGDELPQLFNILVQDGETLTIDRNGSILSASSELFGKTGAGFFKPDPQSWFTYSSTLDDLDSVTIVSAISIEQGLSQLAWVRDFLLITLMISLLVLFGSVAMSAGVAKRQVAGLSSVIGSIHSSADLDQRVDVSGPREIQLLGIRFNDMLEALQRTSASLDYVDSIIAHSAEGIITIDSESLIKTYNPGAEKIFGYPVEDVIGRNVSILLPTDERTLHETYTSQTELNAPRIINQFRELTGRRKDGTHFPMELVVAPMTIDGKRGFVGTIRDITERKEADDMKSEFVSTVSHELRTPLTSIKGSLGLIRSGAIAELPDKLKGMLDIAYNNSDRLVRLINDILDIEKIEAGKMDYQMEPVDLVPLLKQAIESNKGYGDEYKVSFSYLSDLSEARVEGDHDRLMQVLANLLSNAAKFSPAGSNVDISLSSHDTGFRIEVADNGPGIPKAFHDKIFGKFSQSDSSDTRQKGGTGLGLNISKAIVTKHGGTIGFVTEADKGTTFHFDLPELDERQAKQVTTAADNSKYDVLICEDDLDTGVVLEMILQQDGLTTDIARTAAEAEAFLGNNTYDAMTLDLGLPDKDGITLLRELRENPETRDLPIVVVSGKTNERATEIDGNAFGVIDWLEKPIDEERLSESLNRAMQSSSGGKARLLHVEDDQDVLDFVSTLVSDLAEITPAETIAQASSLLKRQTFDLVVLDLMLPDGNGEELLPLLMRDNHKSTPVIIFSAKEISTKTANNIKAILVKSKSSNEALLATIRSAIEARVSSPND